MGPKSGDGPSDGRLGDSTKSKITDLTGISKLVKNTKDSAPSPDSLELQFEESAPALQDSEFLMDFEPMGSEPPSESELAEEKAAHFAASQGNGPGQGQSQSNDEIILEESAPFGNDDLAEFDQPLGVSEGSHSASSEGSGEALGETLPEEASTIPSEDLAVDLPDFSASLDELVLEAEASGHLNPALEVPVLELGGGTLSTITPHAVSTPQGMDSGAPPQGLSQVKEYSDTLSQAIPPVPASVPFTLKIEGTLKPHEQERLLDILSRENMGIRELDLEPQLQAGRILIPRVSEFAAILLVQALRSAHVKIQMLPSDGIVAGHSGTHASGMNGPGAYDTSGITQSEIQTSEASDTAPHPAEKIPVTPSTTFAQYKRIQVIDTVTASATLKSNAIDVESSAVFQQILESLQRELKYKAFRKGATAVLGFSVTVTPQDLPSHYRLLVMGTAVREFSQS